jgi:exosome complex component RRP46
MRSIHVFAFSAQRELLLAESEGEFDVYEWEEACEVAEDTCCKDAGVVEEKMDVDGKVTNLGDFLRDIVKDKVEKEQRWKTAP